MEKINTINTNNFQKLENKNDRLSKVAKDFESIFLAQAFDQMFSSVKMGSMSGGHAEKTWKSFMAQEYAKEVAESGNTGISENIKVMLEKYQNN